MIFKLPSDETIEASEDGTIRIKEKNGAIYECKVDTLLYIIQKFQDHYGYIPVKIDFRAWRGMAGT